MAFESSATNLVAGDTNARNDVFLYDMLTRVTSRISVSSTGVEGNNSSGEPSFSLDGRYVGFSSSSSNFVAGDSSSSDIFLRDTRYVGIYVNVTVSQVNDAPTLDVIADPAAIDEDSGLQTINLSGITAGAAESQTLQITAVSSNPGLVPNPTVFYSSPDSVAMLSYASAADQNGTAVITVTVTDDDGTAHGGVNTITRTFTISVSALNDAPQFAALSNPPRSDESAALQTVASFAKGMAAGPAAATDETTQSLTFNAAIVGTTGTLSFVSPPAVNATTGALTNQATPGTSGTATVRLTLRDDGNGTFPNANISAAQTFTITVLPLSWHNRTSPANVDGVNGANGLDLQFIVEALNVIGAVYLPDLTRALPTLGMLIDVDGNNYFNGLDLQFEVSVLNGPHWRSVPASPADQTAVPSSLDSVVRQGLAAAFIPPASTAAPTNIASRLEQDPSFTFASREAAQLLDAAFSDWPAEELPNTDNLLLSAEQDNVSLDGIETDLAGDLA